MPYTIAQRLQFAHALRNSNGVTHNGGAKDGVDHNWHQNDLNISTSGLVILAASVFEISCS